MRPKQTLLDKTVTFDPCPPSTLTCCADRRVWAGAACPASQGEGAAEGAAALLATGTATRRAWAALPLVRRSARGGGAGRVGAANVGVEAQRDYALLCQCGQLAVQILQLQGRAN